MHDFIVAQASGYNEVAPTFAAENQIPVLVVDNPDTLTEASWRLRHRRREGGYLAGVLAASMTQTGTVGVVLSASGDRTG